MDDNEYIITIIILTLIIILFGGLKKNCKIEYDISKFNYLYKLDIFKKKFKQYNETQIVPHKIYSVFIPNIEKIIIIYLKQNEMYFVDDHCEEKFNHKCLMAIYNYDNINMNDLELLISQDENDGLFYDITDNNNNHNSIIITDIYSIHNNSKKIMNFALVIIKKPHWFV